MPLMDALQDDFSTGTVPDPTLWPNSTAYTVVGGGVVTVTTPGGQNLYNLVRSAYTYTIAGSYLMAKVVVAPPSPPSNSARTYLSVELNDANTAGVFSDGVSLFSQVKVSSVETNTSLGAYDPTAMAYWRVWHNGTGFRFGYSPDAVTWTDSGVSTPSWSVTSAMCATMIVGKFDVADPTTSGTFDKVNIVPSVRSWTSPARRLIDASQLTVWPVTQYTVPAGRTVQVRSVRAVNESASLTTFTISIGTDAAGKRIFYQQPVGANDSFDWNGNIVLGAGEIVQAYAASNAALTLTVSGVES